MRNDTGFHVPSTLRDVLVSIGHLSKSASMEDLNSCVARANMSGLPFSRDELESHVALESAWALLRRPRYKVVAQYAKMLIGSEMKIPSDLVRTPHPVFAISLPSSGIDGIESLTIEGGPVSRSNIGSLLVYFGGVTDVRFSAFMWVSAQTVGGRSFSPIGYLKLTVGDTVENDLKSFDGGDNSPAFVLEMRLAVGVAMLATSMHRCVQHDVIEALRDRYKCATTDDERRRIEELSGRRSGRREWTIGRDLKLYTSAYNDAPDSDGQQLRYQHIRGGHFHTVAYGAGKRLRKVEWFEPTIVRPDLPLKPISA